MRVSVAVVAGLLWIGPVAAQSPPATAALLARADAAWQAMDRVAAFAAYDTLVRADSIAVPRALLRLGTLHGWAGRTRRAIACHARYVALEPRDPEGRAALGRSLAWAGRYGSAVAQFDTALLLAPNSREAVLGRANALAWAGRIDAATSALAEWQSGHPDDAEPAVQRARFLWWRGRSGVARAIYDSLGGRAAVGALTPDAREQWSWVDAEIAPAATARWTHAEDSERNKLEMLEVTGRAWPPGVLRYDGTLRLKRVARSGGARSPLSVPSGVAAATRQSVRSPWSIRGEVGFAGFGATRAATTSLLGGLRVSRSIGEGSLLGATLSRSPFDDIVSAADGGLRLDQLEAEVNHPMTSAITAVGVVSTAAVVGSGDANRRGLVQAEVRATPRRGVVFALSHREVGWSRAAPGVYFAPARFALTEAAARLERPRDLGLVLSGELAVGAQVVRFDGTAAERTVAPRVLLRVGFRPVPGRELLASLLWAASASAGTQAVGEYRATVATIASRWTF